MRSRTDDIFSVEKLRQKWERIGEEQDEHKIVQRPGPELPEPIREFEQLKTLVNQRFPGEPGGEALNGLLEELRILLEKRFPESGDTTEPEKEALNPVIEEILNQIEDLAEALALGGE